ncbi:MAG TPA: hypothetical protein VGQ21_00635 [Thermoanaerobaculia bacterium]|nr:hypothetical protein [Thermoanaerobaculia bacterium]
MTPSEFLEKWSGSAAAERPNAQSFAIDLCAVLNVDPPHAATSADRSVRPSVGGRTRRAEVVDPTDEQILERLVALNAERAEEERRGIIRWLRPEFQNPAGAKSEQQTTMAGIEIEEKEAEAKPKAAIPWPKDLPSQIAAVRDLISSDPTETWTLDRTAKSFKGAKRTQVQSVLDSLAALGLIVTFGDGRAQEWRASA